MMKLKSRGDMKMFSLIKNDIRFIEIEYDLRYKGSSKTFS